MGVLFGTCSPPGKSLLAYSQELIHAMPEAHLPAEAGAHHLANTNKRGIVCWELMKRLSQPFSRAVAVGWLPCSLALLPVPVPSCAGYSWAGTGAGDRLDPPQESHSWEKCFHQSDTAVENGALGGQIFLERGKMLSAEVFVSAGNLYGRVERCPWLV